MKKFKFNLENFIKKKPEYEFKGKLLNWETIQTILSYIVYRYTYNREEGRQMVEIKSSDFQRINSDYHFYLEFLKENLIIIIDYRYTVGEKSRRYGFTDNFKEYGKVLKVKIPTMNGETVYEDKCVVDNVVKRKIRNDYNHIKIKDTDVVKKSYRYKDKTVTNFRGYLLDCILLEELRSVMNPYFKWNEDCRLYTQFVVLSSNSRLNNCYFGNENLSCLDIPSSYPLFLSIWLTENGIDKSCYEFKEFIEEIDKGKFYINLMDRLNKVKDTKVVKRDSKGRVLKIEENEKDEYTRNRTKDLFQTFLNGGNTKDDDMNYMMKTYFPIIFELITNYKQDKERDGIHDLLSQKESMFVFNKLCNRIYREIPNIQLLTCHDSIYFEEQYLEQVTMIWKQELHKIYESIGIVDKPIQDSDLPKPDISLFDVEIPNIQELKKDKKKKLDDDLDWMFENLK